MNKTVANQAELDAAIADGQTPEIDGDGYYQINGGARIVVVRGKPHVEAWGSSQLSLRGNVVGKAGRNVSVLKHGTKVKLKGGKQTTVVIKTARPWCDYYGVKVEKGVAILFKGLNAELVGRNGFSYAIGTMPIAPDWDGGKQECGGGLHFSPHPRMTLEFNESATRFLACPVRLKEIAVHPDGRFPQKVKAKGCCAPVWECDIDGKPANGKAKKVTAGYDQDN